jgi:hypothetical protein
LRVSPIVAVAGTLALMSAHAGAARAPERTIRGHSVVSTHDPAVLIELPASATYVGADRWLLRKYADDIELHAFVDADRARQVRRLYWVQFEAYLPSRPELQHRYTSPRHVTLGGMDFFLDTWLEHDSAEEPDSDGAHLDTLLRSAGYRLPKSRISVRLVHLMDDSRRELMYIYSEDTVATGFSADDLAKGGRAHDQWSGIEAAVIARAQRSIKFRNATQDSPLKK